MARTVINCDIKNVIELYAGAHSYEVYLLLSEFDKKIVFSIIANYKAVIGYDNDFEDMLLYLLNGGELDD